MRFLAALGLALDALLVNKGRSALTSLGIVIGIAAVISMVAAGEGARRKLDQRLDNAGKNLIIVRPGARNVSGISDYAPLTLEDVNAIQHDVGPLLIGVVPVQIYGAVAGTPTANWPTEVTGTESDYIPVGNWRVLYGRSFNQDDVKKTAPVCVLGQTVREKLFPNQPSPIGEWVRLDRLRVQVIGVLARKGRNPLGVDQDNQVFIPLSTMQQRLAGNKVIAMILANVRSDELIDKARDEMVRVLRRTHHIQPGMADNFDVSSVRELAEFAVVMTASLQYLVAVIASISLVVGGIGIMNIMLVAVTERTREIGIRLAIGATPGNILLQFLIEALVLTFLGGIIGVGLGLAGGVALAHLADWPFVLPPGVILVAFLVTAGIGIFFGFYPAWRASRLDPIKALHYE